jgi:hypothetical protein
VGKVYNLYRVKTDISAVLTVTSGLDPHMISELEDKLKHAPCLVVVMLLLYLFSFLNVGFGMNLYLSNQVLIKFDQLKLLIAVSHVRPGCTGLHTWHTSPRIRDGIWPTPYICCNYS